MSCEVCGTTENLFPNHFEEHITPHRDMDICRSCHTSIHTKHTRKRSGPQPRNIRKLQTLGGSRAMTLPMKWVKTMESLKEEKLTDVHVIHSYPLTNHVLLVAPEERVEEYKEILHAWDIWNTLSPKKKEAIIMTTGQVAPAYSSPCLPVDATPEKVTHGKEESVFNSSFPVLPRNGEIG